MRDNCPFVSGSVGGQILELDVFTIDRLNLVCTIQSRHTFGSTHSNEVTA